MQKRASEARGKQQHLGALLLALTLVFRCLGLGVVGDWGPQCGVEARVSTERIGDNVTSAG